MKTWHESTLDGGISYLAETGERDGVKWFRSIDRVIFDRFNAEAGVREEISVHWSEAFRWADFDPCGGLGLSAVIMSDGVKTFAKGLYFGTGQQDEYTRDRGGLAEVCVGCYGPAWLRRLKRPKRDQHGFPIK